MKKKVRAPDCRAHVYYKGRVQGVGFRYTAERHALDLGLVGFVKNLTDGRVELVCEGPKDRVEKLLCELKEGSLGRYILSAQADLSAATGELARKGVG